MRTTATSPIAASPSPATASMSARSMRGSSASIAVTAASARASARKVRWTSSPASGESRSGRENTVSPPRPPSIATSSSSGRRWPTTAASACHRARCAPSTPRRARSMDVSPAPRERRGRRRQYLVAHHGGRREWSRISADRQREPRLLRRSAAGRQRLRQRDRRAARRHRRSRVVIPDGASRSVGLRRGLAAAALTPGKSGPAVAVGSKTGHLFLFDRLTGRPALPHQRAARSPSDVPGEHGGSDAAVSRAAAEPGAAADQRAGHLGRDAAGSRGVPGDLPRAAQRRRLHAAEPPRKHPRAGQHRRAPLGRDGLGSGEPPHHRAGEPPPRDYSAAAESRLRSRAESQSRAEITEQDGAPFSMSRQFLLSPSGLPCVAPPWGELVAVHADTGDIAWRTTLGDLSTLLGSKSIPPTGSPNLGGAAVTSTGLLFIGAAMDPHLRAFDTEEWTAGVGRSAADERPGDASRLHDRERPRDGRLSPPAATTRRSRGQARRWSSLVCPSRSPCWKPAREPSPRVPAFPRTS